MGAMGGETVAKAQIVYNSIQHDSFTFVFVRNDNQHILISAAEETDLLKSAMRIWNSSILALSLTVIAICQIHVTWLPLFRKPVQLENSWVAVFAYFVWLGHIFSHILFHWGGWISWGLFGAFVFRSIVWQHLFIIFHVLTIVRHGSFSFDRRWLALIAAVYYMDPII